MKEIKAFLLSLFQRKIFFLFYTIIEKWILLARYSTFDFYFLAFIFGKDIICLILLGLIVFEKVKVSIEK